MGVKTRAWVVMWWLAAATAGQAPTDRDASPAITGRLIDEAGKPIAGAAVGAFAWNDFVDTAQLLRAPTTTSTVDGSYRLHASRAQSFGVLVLAAADRQACARQITDELIERGGDLGDTMLVPGSRLLGRVRDTNGAPLAGVRLRVESCIADPMSFHVLLLAGATSDAQGIFAVPCVPPTGMRLFAEADGYRTQSRLVALDTPTHLTLQHVGMVRGKVVDAGGAPVGGATVRGIIVEGRNEQRQVCSAADGSFAITVPSTERFRIEACEGTPPYRRFSSELLRGAADAVLVKSWDEARPARVVQVEVIDAASKARIEHYRLSHHYILPTLQHAALLLHCRDRTSCSGIATFRPGPPPLIMVQDNAVPTTQLLAVVVDAPEHGFAVVPVPDALQGPLVVALGPEAILAGRVTSGAGNAVLAGVAVRAMQYAQNSGGGMGAIEADWPRTDGEGKFALRGLRPGRYFVQAHAPDRPASAVSTIELHAGDNRLDLTVADPLWLEFELLGTMPSVPGCVAALQRQPTMRAGQPGFFRHPVGRLSPFALRTGEFRLGPVDEDRYSLQLFMPSRTRVASGTRLELGVVKAGAKVRIELPDLSACIVHGRVVLPVEVPTERIAIVAAVIDAQPKAWQHPRPNVAGIDRDGRFAIDLPAGRYRLQLADVATGIVFHTEPMPLQVGASTAECTLRPELHRLEVQCVPQQPGGKVVVGNFEVILPRPGEDVGQAFLGWSSSSNRSQTGCIPFGPDLPQLWLVPPGTIELRARRCEQVLCPWSYGAAMVDVGRTSVEIDGAEQRVVLRIPPPTPDEVLLRR